MSFPKYPSYKPSGVEWLGDVPAHWAAVRLRQLGRLLKGSGGSKEDIVDEGVPCVRYGDLYTTHRDFIVSARTRVSTERAVDYVPLKHGDVLFAGSGETFEEIGKSAVNLIDGEAVCGGDLVILRPDTPVYSRFLGYACDSSNAATQKAMMGRGTTVKHIYPDELRHLALCVPPPEEQISIVAFLDRETTKIDALVVEQERLIELLKEKRQAVISHAVTKGLNPDAPMKPSGVAWLGDIPAHWRPVPIKHCLERLVDTEHKTAPFVDDGQFLVVRTANVRDGRLVLDGAKFTDEAGFEEWTRRAVPQPGDIIFTREAPAGEACIVPERVPLCLGQRTVLMKIDRSQLEPEFGLWSLYGGLSKEFVSVLAQGSTVAHFNMSDIANVPLLLPPLSEQREIARFVGRALDDFDEVSTRCARTVALLTERRTALISAAVTGQVDVRGLN